MRTNWQLFALEFDIAAATLGFIGGIDRLAVDDPLTLFERKYSQSGQALWRYRGRREN